MVSMHDKYSVQWGSHGGGGPRLEADRAGGAMGIGD